MILTYIILNVLLVIFSTGLWIFNGNDLDKYSKKTVFISVFVAMAFISLSVFACVTGIFAVISWFTNKEPQFAPIIAITYIINLMLLSKTWRYKK